jgi:hypothetical protein
MLSWQKRKWKNIIHVAEKAFVKDAYTPYGSLVMMASARFAILTELAKQIQRKLKK